MRFQKLDLNLLVLLDVLLTHENASRAAVHLNLTQPAVSNALARLRAHFGDDLFVPSGRRMVPTPLAEQLREPIQRFLKLSEEIAQIRRDFDPETTEQIFTIVCSDFISMVVLTRLVRRLVTCGGKISIRHVPISDRVIERFSKGEFDMLIAPDYINLPTFPRAPLLSEEFVPIVWAENPLGPDISMEEFLAAPHVFSHFGDRSHPSRVEEFLAGQGCVPEGRVILENFALVADFVVGTPYLATVHKRYAIEKAQQLPLKVLRPTFPLPTIHEFISWSPRLDRDPALAWLRECLTEVVADTPAARPGTGS